MANSLMLSGIIYGFLLSIIILVKNPDYQKPNFWLGIFILSFTLILFDAWGVRINLENYVPFFDWTYYRAVSIVPFSFWLYVKKSTTQKLQYNIDLKIGWLFVILELVILGSIFFSQGEMMERYMLTASVSIDIMGIFLTLLLFPAIIWAIKKYESQLQNNYSTINAKHIYWLRQLLVLVITLTIVWVLTISTQLMDSSINMPHFYIYLSLCIAIFFIGVKGYLQPEIIHEFELVAGFPKEMISTLSIEEIQIKKPKEASYTEKELLMIEHITKLMESEKVFRVQKLSVNDLAKQLHQSPKFISSLINRYFEQSFSDFVNTYRVEEVKRRFENGDHHIHAISNIAYDSGFNSKSSFYATFKKFTNQSPSDYIQTLS